MAINRTMLIPGSRFFVDQAVGRALDSVGQKREVKAHLLFFFLYFGGGYV